jgi:hypothetical protein
MSPGQCLWLAMMIRNAHSYSNWEVKARTNRRKTLCKYACEGKSNRPKKCLNWMKRRGFDVVFKFLVDDVPQGFFFLSLIASDTVNFWVFSRVHKFCIFVLLPTSKEICTKVVFRTITIWLRFLKIKGSIKLICFQKHNSYKNTTSNTH